MKQIANSFASPKGKKANNEWHSDLSLKILNSVRKMDTLSREEILRLL